MFYHLRNKAGATDFARGTVVSETGEVRYLKPEEWRIKSTQTWKSPETGAQYPSRWRITLVRENLELEIVPQLATQGEPQPYPVRSLLLGRSGHDPGFQRREIGSGLR